MFPCHAATFGSHARNVCKDFFQLPAESPVVIHTQKLWVRTSWM